ncbi:MAG: DUF4249 domain-containing protein [Robiginitalea sp.]
MKKTAYFIGIVLMGIYSCIEEVDIATDLESTVDLDDILVVEATITDQLEFQSVLLSKPSPLGADTVRIEEQNALVLVQESSGASYTFSEVAPGTYQSDQRFAANGGNSYTLQIALENGREYVSTPEKLAGTSVIDDLYADRILSDTGVDGIGIFVDSSTPDTQFGNYKYTYEETYKIIAPNWTALEFEILNDGSEPGSVPAVQLIERTQEEEVCYNTVPSTEVILSEGTTLADGQSVGNLIRFAGSENPIISHRYSILVRQYLQTPAANSFYRSLRDFSSSDNIFSQVQPGLLEGNIRPVQENNSFVLGYFEVSSVAESRLFFDYVDFFPGESLPPYFGDTNCDRFIIPLLGDPARDGPVPDNVTCGQTLLELLAQEEVEFYIDNDIPPGECQGPYIVTFRPCGDCTVLGSNEVPEFWIE